MEWLVKFEGKCCVSLVVRGFVFGGRLVSHACYASLVLNSGEVYGWFFNDEVGGWQIEMNDCCLLHDTDAADEELGELSYPQSDLAIRHQLRGESLDRWIAWDSNGTAVAKLLFDCGSSVDFRHLVWGEGGEWDRIEFHKASRGLRTNNL